MARKTKQEELETIHAEMLKEFDDVQTALKDERMQCLEDRRFSIIPGAMWEGPEAAFFNGRPKFEVNKPELGVLRIQSEYRNNRISADFVSRIGEQDDALADVCDSLYRADCRDSGADEAKDNAFDEAVRGGVGAFRLTTKYEDDLDDENEKQRIVFEPINDADSTVFFDLSSRRQDKSDATRAWIITPMPVSRYKEEYGDDPHDWPKEVTRAEFDWSSPDVVYVAEYYRVVTEKQVIRIYQRIDGEEERYSEEEFEEHPELEAELEAVGTKLIREKKTKRRRVKKYMASGGKILEDCGYIPGPNIPIVMQYGKRFVVDGVERCSGYVRYMKDIIRLKNMQLSTLGEIAALSTVEKPILAAEQVSNPAIREMWERDNVSKYPYLLLSAVTDANGQMVYQGPLGYTKPPQIPPALAALMQITETDLQDMMGNQQQMDKIVSNISGKAVEAIQQRVDMQSYIYINNAAKAEKRSAEIWLGMAKETYVEDGRLLKGIGEQGEVKSLQLNRPVISEDGGVEYENDLSAADFEVSVEIGPSSSTQRQALIRDLTNMLSITNDPETSQVIQAMIMYNMDGTGMSAYRDFWRQKLLKMKVVKPTDEEAKQLMADAQGQPPDPNAQYLQAAADEATANATQARAKTVLTVAQAEETKAKTMKTLSDIDAQEQQQAMDMIDKLAATQQQPVESQVAPQQ